MGEVTSAIVAATLVLGAVFVPVAFLPGTTGLLLRQFGLAVSCAVLISLLNALTLSPALCALWMRPESRAQGPLPPRLRSRLRSGRAKLRPRGAGPPSAARGRARGVPRPRARDVRRSSAPFPRASSRTRTRATSSRASSSRTAPPLERTHEVAAQVEGILLGTPGIVGVNLFGGFDVADGDLPVERRDRLRHARTLGRARREGPVPGLDLRAACARSSPAIPGARVFALNPAPIRGLSRTGGFELQLQDRAGGPLPELAAVAQRVVEAAEKSPELQNVFTTFRPSSPEAQVHVDRAKTQAPSASR